MLKHKRKNKLEKREIITGPTSINVLGSYYPEQQERLNKAEKKMKLRADRVSTIIQLPDKKAMAQEKMGLASDRMVPDVDGREQDRRERATALQKENFDYSFKQAVNAKANSFCKSPRKYLD